MRKLLGVAFLVCFASGCYTMLRHPGVQDTSEPVAASNPNRCTSCHSESELDEMAWWLHHPSYAIGLTPLWGEPWLAYEPWWWHRTEAEPRQGAPHRQSGALVNDRPPLAPLAPSVPPPAILRPPAPASAPPLAKEPEVPPPTHRGEASGTPHPETAPPVPTPSSGGRQGQAAASPQQPAAPQPPVGRGSPAPETGAPAPVPPAQTPAPAPSEPTPSTTEGAPSQAPPAAPPPQAQQGRGLDNDRPGRPRL